MLVYNIITVDCMCVEKRKWNVREIMKTIRLYYYK